MTSQPTAHPPGTAELRVRCVSCGGTPPTTPAGRIYTVSAGRGIEPVCDPGCADSHANALGAPVWVTTKFHPEELDD